MCEYFTAYFSVSDNSKDVRKACIHIFFYGKVLPLLPSYVKKT